MTPRASSRSSSAGRSGCPRSSSGAADPGLRDPLELANGVAFEHWWGALATGLVTALFVVGAAWVLLPGAALAGRRIRLSTRMAPEDVWRSVGNCGSPPRDKSRRFAVVAIAVTVGAWIVLPAAVALALAS